MRRMTVALTFIHVPSMQVRGPFTEPLVHKETRAEGIAIDGANKVEGIAAGAGMG